MRLIREPSATAARRRGERTQAHVAGPLGDAGSSRAERPTRRPSADRGQVIYLTFPRIAPTWLQPRFPLVNALLLELHQLELSRSAVVAGGPFRSGATLRLQRLQRR